VAVIAGLLLALWIALGYGAWAAYTQEIYAQKLIYTPLALAGWLAYRHLLPRIFPAATGAAEAPKPVSARGILAGFVTGICLILPVLAFSEGSAGTGTLWPGRLSDPPLIALLGLGVPMLEELLYRDGLQRFLTARTGNGRMPATAIALSSAVFGLVHAFPASHYIAACGAAFGVLYWRYGLISAILAHAVYNLGLLLAPWAFH